MGIARQSNPARFADRYLDETGCRRPSARRRRDTPRLRREDACFRGDAEVRIEVAEKRCSCAHSATILQRYRNAEPRWLCNFGIQIKRRRMERRPAKARAGAIPRMGRRAQTRDLTSCGESTELFNFQRAQPPRPAAPLELQPKLAPSPYRGHSKCSMPDACPSIAARRNMR